MRQTKRTYFRSYFSIFLGLNLNVYEGEIYNTKITDYLLKNVFREFTFTVKDIFKIYTKKIRNTSIVCHF